MMGDIHLTIELQEKLKAKVETIDLMRLKNGESLMLADEDVFLTKQRQLNRIKVTFKNSITD